MAKTSQPAGAITASRHHVHYGPGAQDDPVLAEFIARNLSEADIDAYGHAGDLHDLKFEHIALASRNPDCFQLADGREVRVYRILPVNGQPGRAVVIAQAMASRSESRA